MKTSQEHVRKWRDNHHAALESLSSPANGKSGMQIWRALRKVENTAHRASTAYCNGDIDSDQWETITAEIVLKVGKILGHVPNGFFVNGDPRGYALKIDPEKGTVPNGLHTDWGRYGILAAEIK